MNVLFLATYGDFLATFELSNIKLWKNLGYTVHCASNFSEASYNLKTLRLDEVGVIKHELVFSRSPIKKENIIAYKELVQIIIKEEIDVIDCHNAVIGAYARIAAVQCHVKKVVYTPHSFFFYDGCPTKNKIIYKSVESFLARKTDLLITINREDYIAASRMKVRGKVLYVPGVGIDTKAIKDLPVDKDKYCNGLSIPRNSKIFISVGELIPRKNHICAIKAFAKANIENGYYLICGIGQLNNELTELIVSLGMQEKIKLLGYRLDVKEIMRISDIYLFPSTQEGLPVALMEAMACGLPCIASKIRGNVDLIDENKGGLLFNPDNENELCGLIQYFNRNFDLIKTWGEYNQERIKEFDINNVQNIMIDEYSKLIQVEG